MSGAHRYTGSAFRSPTLIDVSEGLRIGRSALRFAWRVSGNRLGGPGLRGSVMAAMDPLAWRVARTPGDPLALRPQLVVDHAMAHVEGVAGEAQEAADLSTSIVTPSASGFVGHRASTRDLTSVRWSAPSGRSRWMLWIGAERRENLERMIADARCQGGSIAAEVSLEFGGIVRGVPAINLRDPLLWDRLHAKSRERTAERQREAEARGVGLGEYGLTGGIIDDGQHIGYLASTLRMHARDKFATTKNGRPIVRPGLWGDVHFEDEAFHGPIERALPIEAERPPKDWLHKRAVIRWFPGPCNAYQLSVSYQVPDPDDQPPPWEPEKPPLRPPTPKPERPETTEIPTGQRSRPETGSTLPKSGGIGQPAGGYRDPWSDEPRRDGYPREHGEPGGERAPLIGSGEGSGEDDDADTDNVEDQNGGGNKAGRPKAPQERNLIGAAQRQKVGIAPTPPGDISPGNQGDRDNPDRLGEGYPCCFSEDHPLVDPITGRPMRAKIPCPEADDLEAEADRLERDIQTSLEDLRDAIHDAQDESARREGFDDFAALKAHVTELHEQRAETEQALAEARALGKKNTSQRLARQVENFDEAIERFEGNGTSNIPRLRDGILGEIHRRTGAALLDEDGEGVLEAGPEGAGFFPEVRFKARSVRIEELRGDRKKIDQLRKDAEKLRDDCLKKAIDELEDDATIELEDGSLITKRDAGPLCSYQVSRFAPGVLAHRLSVPAFRRIENGQAHVIDDQGNVLETAARVVELPEAGASVPVTAALLSRFAGDPEVTAYLRGEGSAPAARMRLGRALMSIQPRQRSDREQIEYLTNTVRELKLRIDSLMGGRFSDYAETNLAAIQVNRKNIPSLSHVIGQVARNESVTDVPALKVFGDAVTDQLEGRTSKLNGNVIDFSQVGHQRGGAIEDNRTLLKLHRSSTGDVTFSGPFVDAEDFQVDSDGLVRLAERTSHPDAPAAGARLYNYSGALWSRATGGQPIKVGHLAGPNDGQGYEWGSQDSSGTTYTGWRLTQKSTGLYLDILGSSGSGEGRFQFQDDSAESIKPFGIPYGLSAPGIGGTDYIYLYGREDGGSPTIFAEFDGTEYTVAVLS